MLKFLFSWYKDHEVVRRIGMLLLFLIVFAASISVVYSFYFGKAHEQSLEIAKQEVHKISREALRTAVRSMAMNLAEELRRARERGDDPVEVLRRTLGAVRYENVGYYFVYDIHGVSILHPFHPEFHGQERLQVTDSEGSRYIDELTRKAITGGGFVTYRFTKPGGVESAPKTVYAERIPDSDYWLATGIYLDEIEEELNGISASFNAIHRSAILTVGGGVALILVAVVIPVSLLMISSILHPWRQMARELRHAQKMEAIGIFAGGIAHDFGNVIGAISSCTELALYDTDKSSPVYEDLLHVLKAAKRGKSLVRRISEFSRQTDAPRQPVNMSRVVLECMHLMRSILPANIQVREDIQKNIHALADPDQIMQIIMNLCTNAEQAMRMDQDGVLRVDLGVCEVDESLGRSLVLKSGRYARLNVSDTGVGMRPKIQAHIFEPFYSTRKKSGGTGLGLSMTKGIVTMHGGAIVVHSEAGSGTMFTVYIPCMEHVEEWTVESLPALPGGTESILVVDDDQDFQSTLSKLFRRLGYRVEGRDNPVHALELYAGDPSRFDLVFSDQVMPGMTGIEMITAMRAIRTDLPAVLCSGLEGRTIRQRIPQLFVDAPYTLVFQKPFDTVDLCRGLRSLLDSRSGPVAPVGGLS